MVARGDGLGWDRSSRRCTRSWVGHRFGTGLGERREGWLPTVRGRVDVVRLVAAEGKGRFGRRCRVTSG